MTTTFHRFADLRQQLGLDEAATRLLERAFADVEAAVWDEALTLAARRTYDGQDAARAGYERFRRTMLADLQKGEAPVRMRLMREDLSPAEAAIAMCPAQGEIRDAAPADEARCRRERQK